MTVLASPLHARIRRDGYSGLAEAVIVNAARELPKHRLYEFIRSQQGEFWFTLAGYARGRWLRLTESFHREQQQAELLEKRRRWNAEMQAAEERREARRTRRLSYRVRDMYLQHGEDFLRHMNRGSRERLAELGDAWVEAVLRNTRA